MESEGPALGSLDTTLVSEDTALVSEGIALLSKDTALVLETQLVSEYTVLVSLDTALVSRMIQSFCAEDQGFLSEAVQFPFGFASWRRMIQSFCAEDQGFLSEAVQFPFGFASWRRMIQNFCAEVQGFLSKAVQFPFGFARWRRMIQSFCAEDQGFLSGAVQFPFGFASWRKGEPDVSMQKFKASFRKRSNSLSGRAFRECDPNVSVRRIEASFRERGNSLSGNPCLASLGPGCSANGRFGPDRQLHGYCKAGIAGVYAPRAVFPSLSSGPRCSASWLVWTRRLGLLVFDVVPRAVLLLVSQAPDARHLGRLGPQDSVEVHRCNSWTKFAPYLLLCYEGLGPDCALHSLVFRCCSSSRSSISL